MGWWGWFGMVWGYLLIEVTEVKALKLTNVYPIRTSSLQLGWWGWAGNVFERL